MSKHNGLSDEEEVLFAAMADCMDAHDVAICYSLGNSNFVLDEEKCCIGPKPGCPCAGKKKED